MTAAIDEASKGVTLGHLMRSEWTKIRSVRSTAWGIVAMVRLGIGMSLLATTIYTST